MIFTALIAALTRLAAAEEAMATLQRAEYQRRIEVEAEHRLRHEKDRERAEAMHAEQQEMLTRAATAQANSARLQQEANDRRAEWERIEKEHMAQCEVRYKWMMDRPDAKPEDVKGAKHH